MTSQFPFSVSPLLLHSLPRSVAFFLSSRLQVPRMPRFPSSRGTRPVPTSDRVLRSSHQFDPTWFTADAEDDRAAAAPDAVEASDPTAAVRSVPFHSQHALSRTPLTSSAQLPPPQPQQSSSATHYVSYDPAVVNLVPQSSSSVCPLLPDPVVGTLMPQ